MTVAYVISSHRRLADDGVVRNPPVMRRVPERLTGHGTAKVPV